jgi:acyl-CoA thioesterase-1
MRREVPVSERARVATRPSAMQTASARRRFGMRAIGMATLVCAATWMGGADWLGAVDAQAAESVGSTVLVLGDSLSAGYGLAQGRGWVDLLAAEMARDFPGFKVVNASISGETTLGGLNRLPALLAQHRPAVVVVELGANDGLRGTDVATVRRQLAKIVELSQRAGAATHVIGMRLPPNYGPTYTDQFFALFGSVAKASGSAYTPFLLDGIAEVRAQFQDDGIHPRAEAQPRLLANVRPALLPLLRTPAPAAKSPARPGTTRQRAP